MFNVCEAVYTHRPTSFLIKICAYFPYVNSHAREYNKLFRNSRKR